MPVPTVQMPYRLELGYTGNMDCCSGRGRRFLGVCLLRGASPAKFGGGELSSGVLLGRLGSRRQHPVALAYLVH